MIPTVSQFQQMLTDPGLSLSFVEKTGDALFNYIRNKPLRMQSDEERKFVLDWVTIKQGIAKEAAKQAMLARQLDPDRPPPPVATNTSGGFRLTTPVVVGGGVGLLFVIYMISRSRKKK